MAFARTPFRALSRAGLLLNSQKTWAYTTCRYGSPRGVRQFATPTAPSPGKSKKPFYVTTPIFYVNAGELLAMILFDNGF